MHRSGIQFNLGFTMNFTKLPGVLLLIIFVSRNSFGVTPLDEPPLWSQGAIWYQIFVERFHNGDKSNDPSPESMDGAYPGFVPSNWTITPWNQDWYKPDHWMIGSDRPFHNLVAARRFGGDLKGVLDKLDYLKDLGITAIYLNPINDSPSLHKYDARSYRHIDIHFGPDPQGDKTIISQELPHNMSTWEWTSADKLFLNLIKEIHKRDMKIIVDFSWNHTGITFWAWQDIIEHQEQSRFKDWYEIESFDDPSTPENEFKYHGWLGVKTLPELKKIKVKNKRPGFAFEGDLQPEVKQHIFNVTKRWMDPNNDGDPSDGVDGFRLDVAHHVPLGFWRDYRKFVRSINPDVFLLGEAWWTDWPDQLMDPRPFLGGDIFDSVMHYQWYKPARQFFGQAQGGIAPKQFKSEMDRVYRGYEPVQERVLMNLTASHDSPRFATSIKNKNKYKYQAGARNNPEYDVEPPTEETLREMRLMLLHQFSFISAPHIWNGDEFGMWGADDPDCRKPILWPEFSYETQSHSITGKQKIHLSVKPNLELYQYYKELINFRKNRKELTYGDLHYFEIKDETMVLGYKRTLNTGISWFIANRSEKAQDIVCTLDWPHTIQLSLESTKGCVSNLKIKGGKFMFQLQPISGAILNSVNPKE